jgi:hypothetical protein
MQCDERLILPCWALSQPPTAWPRTREARMQYQRLALAGTVDAFSLVAAGARAAARRQRRRSGCAARKGPDLLPAASRIKLR